MSEVKVEALREAVKFASSIVQSSRTGPDIDATIIIATARVFEKYLLEVKV